MKRYDPNNTEIFLKAKFILITTLFVILIVSAIFVYTAYIVGIDHLIILTELSGLSVMLFALALLVKGKYNTAIHIILISGFATIWTVLFTGSNISMLTKMDTIVFIISLLSAMPLMFFKSKKPMVFYFIINLFMFFLFIFFIHKTSDLKIKEQLDYFFDNFMAMTFVFFISITLFSIYNQVWNSFKKELEERKHSEDINKTFFAISNAVNTTSNIDDLYKQIHRLLGEIIDVTNFFIAVVNEKMQALYFPYYVDSVDDDFSSITNFDTKNSLTGFVISNRKPLLLRKEELQELAKNNGVWGPVPLVWMGVPLIVRNQIIGVIVVQSYTDPDMYSEQNLDVLVSISDQMAIAIDRKRAEDKLKESEEKYRHLFKNAPTGICEIDFEKLRFVDVNDIMCDYSGYSEKDFLSMNPLDLLAEGSKNLFLNRFEKLLAGKIVSDNFEYTIIKKDGHNLNVILSNDFIYQNGKISGARVVVHDITDRKRAEDEKIKAQKVAGEQKKLALVGQVAGKMAHDFNNILGIIMGNTELSLLDCKDTQTRETLELIFEQTLRGKNLTKNLVAFAKSNEPKQEFFKINEKVDLVLKLMKKDLEGIALLKDDDSNVPDLLADPGMIEHALVNLLQNSIHALSLAEHPQIIVRTYCVDMNICIEIEDNGCGIPNTCLKEIYEPSFTLKGSKDLTSSYKTGIKGTGYGMANVKKYIEQHRGTIAVNSEFGSGTKITIGLPVIKKELTSDEKTRIQKEMTQFEKYILLVEDEIAISDVQYKILTQDPCNHKVDTANNGQVAMDLFDRNEYDFVSLDYILPGGINGMDVYYYIREINKAIPILFISGNIEFLESIKILKQKDQYIDHLSKPCMNIDYLNCINKLVT